MIICKHLGYLQKQLIGKNIGMLLPKLIYVSHIEAINQYLHRRFDLSESKTMKRVWAMTRIGTIMPVVIDIQV
jgi:hypothetical protein